MTEIEYSIKNKHYEIKANGHAGDERVCAGISALLYALTGYLLNQRGYLTTFDYKLDDGDAYVIAEATTPFIIDVFTMAVIGLKQIERAEPTHIKVICTDK